MRLGVETLTPEAFAPFGRVIEPPKSPPDATGPGWEWWAETQLLESDGRPFGVGYLDLRPGSAGEVLRFDWAERHMRTVEVILPLDADCLCYVAPADNPEEPGKLAPFESFRVFRVPAGSGIAMEAGVWHGAPLVDRAPARAVVLILEGTPREDVTVVRFEDAPLEIEARAGA